MGWLCNAALLMAGVATATATETGNWKDNAISPVANPLFFESPLIQSEIRPLFIYHKIADDFIGGFARVYAVQARWAVNDRLAIIATKDGYIDLQTRVPALNREGWADLAAGVKYALIDDAEKQFILTPGVKIELPTGNEGVLQGNGKGELDVFVSAMKGWDKVHATASVGARLPLDFSKETSSLHYSVQLDYATCKYFIPFAVLNGFTWLSETENGPAYGGIEGYDIMNFGARDVSGHTQVTAGVGVRSKVCQHVDLGFAWEKGLTNPKGLFDERFTFDAVIHF